MKDQMEVLIKKIDHLCQRTEEVVDAGSNKQIELLSNYIDANGTELLELQIQEHCKELDDEDS